MSTIDQQIAELAAMVHAHHMERQSIQAALDRVRAGLGGVKDADILAAALDFPYERGSCE